ncbi:metallophosphoesterase [Sulfurospirillum sp. 1612]|uniref:metallophosphoesterase n=1 Tax=Sulfurospirillum sp. 1612 TaxID=3094835 RepID=UPI002F9388FB
MFNLLGIFGYIIARYFVSIPSWLYFLLSLPIGVLFLMFCTTVIYDGSRLLLSRVPLSDSRRSFFKKSLDLSSVFLASGLSARAMYNAKVITTEQVDIKIKNLKQPYTIAQISDLHIGGLIDGHFVKNIVNNVNKIDADLVVITGDLLDTKVSFSKTVLLELTKLKSRFGTYYIVGNHEYFHGVSEILSAVRSLGIKVLENENIYIGARGAGFNLAGVYDLFGYRVGHHEPDLNKALQNVKQAPTVLLAHQPKYISEVKKGVDLMLSGHTHGGQIYPFKYLVALAQPYISGLHQHDERLQIYVNKGTGFWGPPMRLGASAEITHITLLPS